MSLGTVARQLRLRPVGPGRTALCLAAGRHRPVDGAGPLLVIERGVEKAVLTGCHGERVAFSLLVTCGRQRSWENKLMSAGCRG